MLDDLTPNSTMIPGGIQPRPRSKKWLLLGGIVILVLLGASLWYLVDQTDRSHNTMPHSGYQNNSVQGLQLNTKKNYGNKYANGLVPVGDSRYVTDAAKQGYILVCNANFVPANQAGAQARGPWFVNNNAQYDLNKKSHVAGNVDWTPSMTNTISGDTRTIATNDLPTHKTGVFPVESHDPAYVYDRNPNTIKSQLLTYNLNAKPDYGSPQCVSGEVGVMLTGVALFDGFDAGGRDAGAWEVQDGCDGHPQDKGEYHYHSLSRCITDIGVGTVIGFALDGFPITGPQVGKDNILTTNDLDECHGIVSEVILDGKKVTTYHYVMTQDFPYSVGCFRSHASAAPGLPEGSSPSQQSGGQQPSGSPNGYNKPPPPVAPPHY